jgi:peptidyl-prolyl cis-trans isomerase D
LGESLKQRLAQVQGQRVYQQYIDALRANAEVTISQTL